MNQALQCSDFWTLFEVGFQSASYLFFALLALFLIFNLISRYGDRSTFVAPTLAELERKKKFLELIIQRRKKSLETSESK